MAYPLSKGQQALWFLCRTTPGSAAYHLGFAIRIRSETDAGALKRAAQHLSDRHSVLRAVFKQQNGVLTQAAAPRGTIAFRHVDATARTLDEIRTAVDTSFKQPFDLESGPPVRLDLYTRGTDDHVLLLTAHHIVFDGWSLWICMDELAQLLRAELEGVRSDLPSIKRSFREHVEHEQVLLSAKESERFWDYWQRRLAGCSPAIDLPVDRPRPAEQTHAGGSHRFWFDAQLSGQLRALAQAEGVTPFMLLLAAFQMLLHRWTGEEDILIGSPVAGRSNHEFGNVVGYFANLVVLRAAVDGAASFRAILRQARSGVVEALAHQNFPFALLVERLQPPRDPGFSPLVQVSFSFQKPQASRSGSAWMSLVAQAGTRCSWGGLEVEPFPFPQSQPQFDLELEVLDANPSYVCVFKYKQDLFDLETIERLSRMFSTLIRGIVGSPHACVRDLQVLDVQERAWLLHRWEVDRTLSPQQKLIHERFEEQVERAPEATAVICEGDFLTYAQLNARANSLARLLRAKGVGPDRLVGLCVERGLAMVVGLLAILKSGGAYVPLDPDYPAERLAYMLADAAPRVLLTQEKLRAALPNTPAEVITLEDAGGEIAAACGGNLDSVSLRPHHLAYVIYTSGSTGRPKGVMVEHRHVTRLFASTEQWFGFDEREVWTVFHSFAFDFSVWELWGALLYGGRAVIVPYLTARSPHELYRLICEQGVTVLSQTPSAFAQLSEAQAQSTAKHSLRLVILGGEALQLRTLQPWVERNGVQAPQLVNMYGITETTVHATYHRLTREEIEAARGSPIGRPLPDLQLYLLDRYRHPVAVGVTGEIYVGGAGVARGYLNLPKSTAERFSADPFDGDPCARLYKSGDLGRLRADGTLEYLGRNDHQVKIRGFRIEPGEIEAQLLRHAQVQEAVVIAREDVPGEKRLVAYVVPRDRSATDAGSNAESELSAQLSLSAEALRAHLKQMLPEYMVPSGFVMLERLPLTAHGKLDRRALPPMDPEPLASREYEAPQGEVEERLAEIWRQLLHVERVGRDDSFFELGGHSLLLLQMMERLRGVGLFTDIRKVFERPKLTDLASALTREPAESVEVPPNSIPPGCAVITPKMLPLVELDEQQIERIVGSVPGGAPNIQDIYPLAPLQEGILFHHLLQQGDPYLLSATLSFDSRERLDGFVQVVQRVVSRHDVLRTAVLWEGLPEPVQVVWRQACIEVQMLELHGPDVQERLERYIDPQHYRLDVRQAPLLRGFAAFDEQADRWLLQVVLHHLVADHRTLEGMLQEAALIQSGREHALSRPIPFRNFVAQARLGMPMEEHERFFRELLSDVQEPTAPYGVLQVHGNGADAEEERQPLERPLSQRIREQARQLGVSAASVFHWTWGLVLGRVSGRDDVVFGTVLLGRLHGGEGADRALGLFINTLPMRVQLGEVGVAEGIKRTHASLAQLVRHEHASLSLAQRCSSVPAHLPLFSALLNYRHSTAASAESAEIGGVRVLFAQERTNYPCTLSVDDFGTDFALSMQVVPPMQAQRLCRYMHQALEQVVQALAQAPQTPACRIEVLDEAERHQVQRALQRSARHILTLQPP